MTRVDDWILVVIAAVFGVCGLYAAVKFRQGMLRGGARWYIDRSQPFYVRNMPFVQLPAGLGFTTAAAAIALDGLESGWAQVVVGLAVLIGFVAIVLGAVWIIRPPRFLKPDWIREREASAAGSHGND